MTDVKNYSDKINTAINIAKQCGYARNNELPETIEFLCDEIDRYRAKIESLEEAIEKSKIVTANEERISEGQPPIDEDIKADILTEKEKQALSSAKDKMLAIYETLTPEETRAWEMGEVYAEIIRGFE